MPARHPYPLDDATLASPAPDPLVVAFPDGSRYEVPAAVIAAHYADSATNRGVDREASIAYILASRETLAGWARLNMDWGRDLAPHARRLNGPIRHDPAAEFPGAEIR